MTYIEHSILEKVNRWLTPSFDTETQEKIKELISYHPRELADSFYKDLEFGTGGMRGIMGVGDNRINKYTLGKNSQGIANYMKAQFPGEKLKVAIAYDCRHNSKTLARTVAEVFSANGVEVFLFSDLRPTPELSFAVNHLGCQCGIVLTASHNPPEYNGYKVYWKDGGQLVPPQDAEIIVEIRNTAYTEINFTANESLIHLIGKDVDEAFLSESLRRGTFNVSEEDRKKLKIVFTSLHGTSIMLNPEALKRAGFTDLHLVKEQEEPDGDFPTVESPNPEEPEALKMAMELAEKEGADIVIGTDPDGDRLGIAVRNENNELFILNGNQAMVLMTDFLLSYYKENNSLPESAFIASTIVSTPMMEKLAEAYNVECKISLTGFKWIAKMIKDHPDQKFIGGGEESFGYMVSDFVRDKDSVTSTLLACEMAAKKKAENSSLFEYFKELAVKHGCYKEHLISQVKKGREGAEEIDRMMKSFRENPLKEIAGYEVTLLEDYASGVRKYLNTGKEEKIDIPKSNVLIYTTENGTKVAVRPSGTEPKIKFYISVHQKISDPSQYREAEKKLDKRIEGIIASLKINS